MTEALFEMANLFPEHTGVLFVVWFASRGTARHDVRVKVWRNANAIPAEMASIAVRPSVHIVEGAMAPEDLDLLITWIAVNRDTLAAYWEGEIDAKDAIDA